MTRVLSPPSPRPSYWVRSAIPRTSSKIWRWVSTARRQTPSQSGGDMLLRVRECRLIPGSYPLASVGHLDLEPSQLQAIEHGEGPLLVLGAAGTGKSEALARRLARLAEEGTGPEQVLVITSGETAARHLRERAEALLEGPYEELWIGTWEEIGERLLRDYAAEAGLAAFVQTGGPAPPPGRPLPPLAGPPPRPPHNPGNPPGGGGPPAPAGRPRPHPGAGG